MCCACHQQHYHKLPSGGALIYGRRKRGRRKETWRKTVEKEMKKNSWTWGHSNDVHSTEANGALWTSFETLSRYLRNNEIPWWTICQSYSRNWSSTKKKNPCHYSTGKNSCFSKVNSMPVYFASKIKSILIWKRLFWVTNQWCLIVS